MDRHPATPNPIPAALASAALAAITDVALHGYGGPAPLDWAALAVLALGGALAHTFPLAGRHLPLANAFVAAGSVVLPPHLITWLPPLAAAPALWRQRRNPRGALQWVTHVAHMTLAAHAAGAWVRWVGYPSPSRLHEFAALAGATALFAAAHELLAGWRRTLTRGAPAAGAAAPAGDPWPLGSRSGNLLATCLGFLLAVLWTANPLFLAFVVPVLALAKQLDAAAQVAQLARLDPKTGLLNSRHFEALLEDELARSRRLGRPVGLLFADLDLMRQVNNRYGHLAGDRVLREVAGLIAGALRRGDVVARFGGEEFVALLPGAGPAEAAYLAERVRQAVEGHTFWVDGGAPIHCTISVGVAVFPDDADNATDLIQQADKALYRAKESRNAVRTAGGPPPVPRLQVPDAGAGGASAPDNPAARNLAGGQATARPAPPRLARWLLWAVVAGGAAAATWSARAVDWTRSWPVVTALLALAVVADMLKVRIYERDGHRISLSFTACVTTAAITLLPPAAPLVTLTGAIFHVVTAGSRRWDRSLFNLANATLAAALAAWTYTLARPATGSLQAGHLLAALAAVTVFSFANFGPVAAMVSLHTGRGPGEILRSTLWSGPFNMLLGVMGAFLGSAYRELGPLGILIFTAPVLLLRYAIVLAVRQSERTIAALAAAKYQVEAAHREKEETLRDLLEAIGRIIDSREGLYHGHARRVAAWAVALGRELGLGPDDLAVLHTAGLLHDVGKLAVPETLLHKPGPLTPDEYEVVKRHAALGEEMLAQVPALAPVARLVGEHHERFDGTGYPRGKAGQAISLGGRILAVADALDAILSDRPYARGRPLAEAVAELDRCAGTHFDPQVVAALHRLLERDGDRPARRSPLGANFLVPPVDGSRHPHQREEPQRQPDVTAHQPVTSSYVMHPPRVNRPGRGWTGTAAAAPP